MQLWVTLRLAVRAIAKHKLRSWLTVTGIVIGVAAVTAAVSMGKSASLLVEQQVSLLGTNVLIVVHERGTIASNRIQLTVKDVEAIRANCPAVSACTPQVNLSPSVVYGHLNRRPFMMGVGVDYFKIRNWKPSYGKLFVQNEVKNGAKVCVVGNTIAEKLFRGTNPIGKTLRIGAVPVEVIGVLEAKGASIFGNDQDDIILMPYSTVRKRLQGTNFDHVDTIGASAHSVAAISTAKRQIRRVLRQRHGRHGKRIPFGVRDTAEFIRTLNIVTQTLALTIGAIAIISLLVGGIGIMNIMLVSVTERTREIGIRMSVGAKPKDILRQFLTEAIVLSCMGGALGIPLGMGASIAGTNAINAFIPNVALPATVSYPAAAVAMLFAAAVGVFFGYTPARRASRLDPIECLRYE